MRRLVLFLAACSIIAAGCLNFKAEQIPPKNGGSAGLNIVAQEYPRSDVDDPVAALRIFCAPVMMDIIDPFQPTPERRAAWHLHTFYGNTAVTADSTLTSMATTGNSTCDGGTANRSAYWSPTMLWPDPGQTGEDPFNLHLDFHNLENWNYGSKWGGNLGLNGYYKSGYDGVTAADVDQWMPPGLGIIAGNPQADAPGENPHVWYGCRPLNNTGPINPPDGSNGSQWHIPACPVGNMVVMVVEFPQCWDGVHYGDEPGINYVNHMAYGTENWEVGCPEGFPVALPQLTQLSHHVVTAQNQPSEAWHLSSDMYAFGNIALPGGYSGHADVAFGWRADIGARLLNWCYRGGSGPYGVGFDCHGPLLGPNPTTGQLEMLAGNIVNE